MSCQLRLKAKPGSASQVEVLLKKLFNPQRRFALIPSFVYLLLENRGLRVSVTTEGSHVVANFTLNSIYSQAVTSFVSSFNSSDFKRITKDGFNLSASLKGRDTFLAKAVNYATLEDDFIFPHLLENSKLDLRYSSNSEVLKAVDSFLTHLDPKRSFPHISCASMLDIEAEFDFDSTFVQQTVHPDNQRRRGNKPPLQHR